MNTQELRDKRANTWSEMQNIISSTADRTMTAEERGRYEALEADLQEATANIDLQERHAATGLTAAEVRQRPIETAAVTAAPTEEDNNKRYAKAFSSWLRYGREGIEPEDRAILTTQVVDAKELRALGVGTGSAGGYAVAPAFRQEIIETMKAISSVRSVAQVITTDTGATLNWPTLDDTANVGAILAENTQASQLDVALGTAALDVYMYTSKIVLVSLQLAQDSAFDIDSWLPRTLATRLARIQNQHFTTGTGTAQPEGIQTNATVGVTLATGNTTTVTYAGLVNLIASIDPSYRADAQFMASDTAVAAVRNLVDSQNRPLWEMSVQAGNPDRILGYPLVINNDLPVPAANAKSVLFGDFDAAYVIRDVLGIQQLRLEERYADYLQVGYLAFLRTGARPQQPAAIRALKQSAT